MKKYNCNECIYSTNRKYDYRRHLNSEKHLKKSAFAPSPKRENLGEFGRILHENPPSDDAKLTHLENLGELWENILRQNASICSYCKRIFQHKKNLARHYKICKKVSENHNYNMKLYEKTQDTEKDKIIENLLKDKIRAEERSKVAEEQLAKFIKEVSTQRNVTINNNTIMNHNHNHHNTINMHYIKKHYNNAKDYDELMNAPMTEEEEEKLYRLGANYAVEEMIESRCIKNLKAEERPIHCVDGSRDKFMIRKNNAWKVDNKGTMIVAGTFNMLKKIFIDDKGKELREKAKKRDYEGIDTIITNQQKAASIITHKNDKQIMDNLKNSISVQNINSSNMIENIEK